MHPLIGCRIIPVSRVEGGLVARVTRKKTGEGLGESGKGKRSGFKLLDEGHGRGESTAEELPRDGAGRLRIKRQYEELLGIRITKLVGRILNRERIDKVQEGIYFICAACGKVCHNLDEGLVEDAQNQNNRCLSCAGPGAGVSG